MAADPDRANLRLAELVAALSLGIDLGFGQPMEHVIRQCLIALRLAERARARTTETRAIVYYTGLLVNVGCHTDAHEQAKWFGDDIALKAEQVRPRADERASEDVGPAPAGGGQPPLHRLRVGVAFATSGYKELNDMFAHARGDGGAAWRSELELPGRCAATSLLAAYESWDGRGWPERARGRRRSRWRRASCSSQSTPRSRTALGGARGRATLARRARAAGSSIRRSTAMLSVGRRGDLRRSRFGRHAGKP